MSAKKIYKDYFKINERYFPQVTEALIKEGKVSWKNYFANDSFINALREMCDMINGRQSLSMITYGPYGSGKSHMLLTLISMLNAPDEEITEYFEDQKLDKDLMNKFIATKNSGKIVTIHRIGSSDIHNDRELVVAVQQSIMSALKENGIENKGEGSMRDSFLEYISRKVNRDYFSALIKEEKYAADFAAYDMDSIEKILRGDDDKAAEKMTCQVIKVLMDVGQYGLFKDTNSMSEWIKDIIDKNNLKAIIFAWDEFSEFLEAHSVGITGFQTLLEISNSSPFYFILSTHMLEHIFADQSSSKKFFDRFQRPVEIKLPENTAFKLLSQAMKTTDDPLLSNEWTNQIKPTLNEDLSGIRRRILQSDRTRNGKKSDFTDDDLCGIVPIHPFAALVLSQLASLFNSNQRSMFDFIINDSSDYKGFKWFIQNYGPLDQGNNILTVDFLWDFFCGKQVQGLNNDVKGIFLSYDGINSDKLYPEEKRVLKTILILQAVSIKLHDEDVLLSPTEESLELAFMGTDFPKGKATAIARGLIENGLLFEKLVAGGKKEYVVANGNVGTVDIEKYKQKAKEETKTSVLITNAQLLEAVSLPDCVKMRYLVEAASENTFSSAISNLIKRERNERIKAIITFAMNDNEAAQIKNNIIKRVKESTNDIVFVESLTPMGTDLYNQYIENLTYSKYHAKKDNEQAKHYQIQAEGVLQQWKDNIKSGAFMVYTTSNPNGERKANLNSLQEWFRQYDIEKYPDCLEQYNLNNTLYGAYNLAQGAGFGINEEAKNAFHNTNKRISIENALAGAWGVERYWEDTSKSGLVIVKVKNKIEEIIQDGFNKNNGEISILEIFDEMEKPPFGFMPNSITSFVLGFCLKEYANANYFWSNHSNTEPMSPDKMKTMIANTLNERTNHDKKYKEEFIVTMTAQMKTFLNGSSKIFKIDKSLCTSIEKTRDQICCEMRKLKFPIWCIKWIIDDENVKSDKKILKTVIDKYTGIANTANSNGETESSLAEQIGKILMENSTVEEDLSALVNDEKCRDGMIAFIRNYKNGELTELATKINDGGQYIEEVRKKFNATDSNWLWNISTAEEKISDVILEYKIIEESNKSLSACHSLNDTISEWNRRTNNIKMPCEAASKQTGDLGAFLEMLLRIKNNNSIANQDKEKFYDLLCTQRTVFDDFYKNQVKYFVADANSLLTDLNDTEIEEIYNNLPAGQFTKNKTEYYNFIQHEIDKYVQSQWKKKMQNMWQAKTGTKNPVEWSELYKTPILCMVDENDSAYARKMFDIIKSVSPSEDEAKQAIEFMENANFYDRLSSKEERDNRFMKYIVGSDAVLLGTADEIRNELYSKVSTSESPYYWLNSSYVRNCLKQMVDKQYKLKGCEMANKIVDNMDTNQLRDYLKKRIADDVDFGIQILKGEGEK